MAFPLTNYQCLSCRAPLRYDESRGELVCDYCGNSYSVSEIDHHYKEQIETAEAAATAEIQQAQNSDPVWDCASDRWDAQADGMVVYHCPSCGAELLFEKTMAAGSCPYCANPNVVPGQFQGLLKPDYILPFRISKQQAIDALKDFYKGKMFLPRAFSDRNHLEEIKGIYVPFWLFDGKAKADISYQATKVHYHTRGNERLTVTENYRLRRSGSVSFSRIPVDGSSKMPDPYMDAVEPFDYSELKPFSSAYMPGFIADIYDVDAESSFSRADERAAKTAEKLIDSTVSGYATAVPTQKQLVVQRGNTSYAFLPVWLLTTKWNGKVFLFAINGQTGKLVGDLPVSKGKYLAWFSGIAACLTALLSALLLL